MGTWELCLRVMSEVHMLCDLSFTTCHTNCLPSHMFSNKKNRNIKLPCDMKIIDVRNFISSCHIKNVYKIITSKY